jgi:hypothetical protein
LAWIKQQEKKQVLAKEKEERHVLDMTEKYGKLWHRKVAGTSEDCPTAGGIRSEEQYAEYCEEGRLYYEDAERERALHAKWENEDKEREERRATMTKKEKQQEEEDWEDAVETAYQKEQDATDYRKMTGIVSR